MPTFFQPGWLLLLWCGLGAAIVAWPLARASRNGTVRTGRGRRLLAVGLELLLFPVLYALLFEALGRADIVAGAALGTLHATLGVIAARPGRADAPPGSAILLRSLARILYGIVFAFLYVVPAP